ncbi:GntR family transcriptional regulator [Dyadobacter beijingensis]|uniref:GntR family transcriptional regulator n=1 Tax=Dyadobacter beijingensis TaxID=365489 RepID=A0ABQ2HKG4_9BACT|nr:GntR family transcriptional regulator [Dyadobacter beijingensis]GGM83158.1 GntR family transcriptional regulator [Dyadobacter beijingensis]
MRKINFEDHFTVDRNSSEPVYQQLVEAVLHATKTGLMDRGDRLPSINELSRQYAVSRSTIEKSYNNLRDMGILASQHGKSYYINRLDPAPELKVLVLFNQLNEYNKAVYDALIERIGHKAIIDFHIYHHSAAHFRALIRRKQASYSHIAVIPHFLDDPESGYQAIERLPKDKLIILDKEVPGLAGHFGTVFEHFSRDIDQAIQELAPSLRKYQCINLIFPELTYYPPALRDAFTSACSKRNLICRISAALTKDMVRDGEAFIVLSDEQLMFLVRTIINNTSMIAGRHVGIVSYQDNDAKKAMLNGITTISSDWKAMGRSAADMILTGVSRHVANPFSVILRRSL